MYFLIFIIYLILLLVSVTAITFMIWWIVAPFFQNNRKAHARGLQFLTYFGLVSGILHPIGCILVREDHWAVFGYIILYVLFCLSIILVLLLSRKYSKLWGSFIIWLMMIAIIWFDEILDGWIMPLINKDYQSMALSASTLDFTLGIVIILSMILIGITYWYAMKGRKEA